VHLAIADIVNDTHGNEFWMSIENLANKARVARSTVSLTLADMVEKGLLDLISAGGDRRKPSRYRFSTSTLTGLGRPTTGLALDRSPDPIPSNNSNDETKHTGSLTGLVAIEEETAATPEDRARAREAIRRIRQQINTGKAS
jgi:hypothetical protein